MIDIYLFQPFPKPVTTILNSTSTAVPMVSSTLEESVDLTCSLLDIPIHKDGRIQALHLLFSTYVEYKKINRQK